MPGVPASLNYADISAILPLVEARLGMRIGVFAQSAAKQGERRAELEALQSVLQECLLLEENFSGKYSAKTKYIQGLVLQLEQNLAFLQTSAIVQRSSYNADSPLPRTPLDTSDFISQTGFEALGINTVSQSISVLRLRLIAALQNNHQDKELFQQDLHQLKLDSHVHFFKTLYHTAGLSAARKNEIYIQFFHEHTLLCEGPHAADYLGLDIGREIGACIAGSIPTERSKAYLKDPMSWFNRGRLYWVWGNATITSVLEKIPDWLESGNIGSNTPNPLPGSKETCSAIGGISVYTGYLSFILYYARFAIELFLLLKNTLLISEEEATQKNRSARLKEQWQQRKFMLLNDGIWATANMVCFFWLVGSNTLNLSGDILTVALLVMDAVLTIWRFIEEQQQYQNQRAFLEGKIRSGSEEEKRLFTGMLAELDKNWQQKKLYTVIDLAYSISLLASFALHVAISNTPALKALLGPMGAILCFSMGFLQSIVTNGLELHKINKQLAQATKAAQVPNSDEPFDEVAYLKAMQKYQITKSCMNFFVEGSFPFVFYLAFTCLSGLAGGAAPWLVAAAFLVVTVALPKILEPIFKPSQEHYKNRNRFLPTKPEEPGKDVATESERLLPAPGQALRE